MNLRNIITDIFGLDGRKAYLEKYNNKFKKRDEQNIVVEDVLSAFEGNKKHILMEAPTGTGKTFIYAFIAITDYILKLPKYNDITNKPYICIVTNNKALQKQLVNDLNNVIIPAILKWFTENDMGQYVAYAKDFLNVGTFKSKSNYMCSSSFSRYTERNVATLAVSHIKNEQTKQKTKSIDYDLMQRNDNMGHIIVKEETLQNLSCKESDPKTCKDPNCTCHRKLEDYNIMITNYDYLFLLSGVMDLKFIGTLILDECHNIPDKLVNNTNEKFDILEFNNNLMSTINNVSGFLNEYNYLAKNLPEISEIKSLSENIKNITVKKLKKLIGDDEDNLKNITFSITGEDMTSNGISPKLSKLNVNDTVRLLRKEQEKSFKIYEFFGDKKNIENIIKLYKKTLVYRIMDILELITNFNSDDCSERDKGFKKARIWNEIKKIKDLSANIEADILEIFDNLYGIDDINEIGRVKEEEINETEIAFEKSELLKNEYKTAKNLSHTLEQAILYRKTMNQIKKYNEYLEELCEILRGNIEKDDIENNPDVIFIENIKAFGNKNEQLNIIKLNDNTETLFKRFLVRTANARIMYSSATMTTDDSYNFFMSQLGLHDNDTYKSKIPESPFKKEHRQWLFLGSKIIPDTRSYEKILTYKLDEIVRANPSGSLILCTSKKSVTNAYNCTKDIPDRIINSNATPLQTILDNVKNNKKPSVIIGNIGFWEGLDLQGDAVTMVVISKLPYRRLNDPQIVSRFSRELFEKIENRNNTISVSTKWWDYYNNLMKITFYQGVGRLLRGVDDYGVILCLFPENNLFQKFRKSDKRFGITSKNIIEIPEMEHVPRTISMFINDLKNKRSL